MFREKMSLVATVLAIIAIIVAGVAMYQVSVQIEDLRESVDESLGIAEDLEDSLEAANEDIETLADILGIELEDPEQVRQAIELKKLEEAAKAAGENAVNIWYLYGPEAAERVIEGFESRYPFIHVEGTRMLPAQWVPILEAQIGAGKVTADLIQAPLLDVVALLDEGYFQPYAPIYPDSEFRTDVPNLHGPDDMWFCHSAAYLVAAYHTERVDPPPTSWDDLLEPRFKGRLGWYATPHVASVFLYEMFKQELGQAWLDALGQQEIKPYNNAMAQIEALLLGDIDVCIGVNENFIWERRAEDPPAPIAVMPSTPLYASEIPTVLVNDAPHPNAAKLFYCYSISEEGQALASVGQKSTRLGIPWIGDELWATVTVESYAPSLEDTQARRDALWEEYKQLIGIP